MKTERKQYEAPDIKKTEFANDEIMKISTQDTDDNGEGWGEFIPFKKSAKSSSANNIWDENW